MSDVVEPMIHEDRLPGHESRLEPEPDWRPRYPGSDRLKGKVALITGGDSGIGRAVAACSPAKARTSRSSTCASTTTRTSPRTSSNRKADGH